MQDYVFGADIGGTTVNLGWGVFNIKERINELLPEIPNVAAGNDANVAALGNDAWIYWMRQDGS